MKIEITNIKTSSQFTILGCCWKKVKVVNIEDLIAKYRENEFKANRMYKSRVLEMKCVVVNIIPVGKFEDYIGLDPGFFKKIKGGTWVNFDKEVSESKDGIVRCVFGKKYTDEINKLKISDTVIIRGKPFFWSGIVVLLDAVLVSCFPKG